MSVLIMKTPSSESRFVASAASKLDPYTPIAALVAMVARPCPISHIENPGIISAVSPRIAMLRSNAVVVVVDR